MRKLLLLPFLVVLATDFAVVSGQELVITEFAAANDSVLADEDGDFPDWIELYSIGPEAVDLSRWFLTDDADDPSKWPLPAGLLQPGGFLVVFASGKDRRDPDAPPHTNFKLSRSGEFLAVVGPGGSSSSFFAPEYPPQQFDASYGLPMESRGTPILAKGFQGRALVTQRASDLANDWNVLDFDDSGWMPVTTGVGFDRKDEPTLADLVPTDVGDLMMQNASIFLRFPFDVGDEAANASFLRLLAQYESGFIAYVNGVEVARRNAPDSPRPNSSAAASRSATLARTVEEIGLMLPAGLLRPAQNVLAVQALNDVRTSPDFLFVPGLEFVEVTRLERADAQYFASPTPGGPNAPNGQSGIATNPTITPSTSFTGSLTVEIAAGSPAAEIRFTTDGSEPQPDSPLYEAAFEITTNTRVLARNFEPGLVPSVATPGTYVALEPDVMEFDSDLPIFLISSFGIEVGQVGLDPMHIEIIETEANGRASVSGPRALVEQGGIKIRGSSSAGNPKTSYSFEIQDSRGEDMEVEVLGLEADSDWVLYGPHTQDDSLIRNAFMYELSNQAGRYAVRTRFCEVFVSEGATLGSADYVGLYVLMEKITLGEHRVDVEELTPDIVEEPEISGGYIFKIDRLDPNDQGFTAGNQQLAYVDPKEEDMVKRPEQAAWIKEYIDAFGDALGSEDFADPVNGYAAYIDVDSWIDHHILNEFAKNVDGFRLSAFFFKPRGGKIQAGPIWDFDLSLTRHREPGGAEGWSTSRFSVLWWVRLFEDEAFEDRMRSRWRELRQGAFQLENLLSVVDSMADEIREAQARNFERWNIIFGGTTWQEDEIDRLKTWITQRVAWMDGALVKPPELSHPGGPVAPGLELTMSVARGEVYYTLNGPDPRGKNDLPDPAALRYVGPIVLDGNVRVIARTFTEDGLWSPDVRGDYLADIPPLVLTEIMYHPRAADTEGTTSDLFEFIELHNAGTETIDLTQVRFTGIPDFDFANGAVSSLAPGEHVVVVSDLESFRARYGDAMDDRIAGDYDRSLGNRGQILRLVATLIEGSEDQELWRMRYEASWHPSTDGAGHSLVLVDPATPPELYGDAATWQPSAEIDGSPGRADGVQAGNFRQPGDMNGDNRLNIVDVLGLLNGLTGRTVLPCDSVGANTDLGDMNGDGRLNVLDPLHLLSFLFRDGAAPEAGLDCISLPGCPESCEG